MSLHSKHGPFSPLVLSHTRLALLCVGICQAGKPIYVTELASAKYRGRVMAGFSLAFSAGIGAVRVMESLLKGTDHNGIDSGF